MTKRFFKATDGTITFFRATGRPSGFRFGVKYSWGIGFANSAIVSKAETFPATEITKAEFSALTDLKAERIAAAGRDNVRYSSPQDMWVANDALAGV